MKASGKIPAFRSEAQERVYWETHDSRPKHLTTAARTYASSDQSCRECTGRPVSVANQGMVGGEALGVRTSAYEPGIESRPNSKRGLLSRDI